MGLSAVCAYNMTAVEEVFSKGKYMQKATVEQSHTKWVRYNGIPPSPRPGAVSACQLSTHMFCATKLSVFYVICQHKASHNCEGDKKTINVKYFQKKSEKCSGLLIPLN